MTTNTPTTSQYPLHGRCACGTIRYTLSSPPLIIHCCHCSYCQRESGSAFAINAVIESSRITLLTPDPIPTSPSNSSPTQPAPESQPQEDCHPIPKCIATPSLSGKNQIITRCPRCGVAVWSNYAGGGDALRFVRVGTLDGGAREDWGPDVHIYTASKVKWVVLPPGARAVEEFYDVKEVWSQESLERWAVVKGSR